MFDYFVHYSKHVHAVYGNSRSRDEVKHMVLQSHFPSLVDRCTVQLYDDTQKPLNEFETRL